MKQIWRAIKTIDKSIMSLISLDLLIGIVWFAVESGTIVVLNGFLTSMGIVQLGGEYLPSWYPRSFESNLLCLIIFGFVRAVAIGGKQFFISFTGQAFAAAKRKEIIASSLGNRIEDSNSTLVALYSKTVSEASSFITYLSSFFSTGISCVLFFALTFYVAPFETIIGTVLLAALIAPLRSLNRKIGQYGADVNDEEMEAYSVLMNGLKNIFFLRLYQLVDKEIRKGHATISRIESLYRNNFVLSSFTSAFPQFIGIFVLVIAAWAGRVFQETTPVVTISFFYLFTRMAHAASALVGTISYMKFAIPSYILLEDKLADLKAGMFTQVKVSELPENSSRIDSLRVEKVTGGYDRLNPLFEDISFEIIPSKMVLVKGPSGCGKSTLLKTIFGTEKAFSGSILVNGAPFVYSPEMARHIGYVGPEPYILHASVRENLLYGNDYNVSDEEMLSVLDAVGLREKILSFKQGLGEILKDDSQLSTGQMQRISFARALLRRPSILVLDEATANIDSETELRILEVLSRMKNDLATFVITHKNSFDVMADQTIHLDSKH